ncbi:L domain-like protein [Anaeromyces robustus]|uniref:L domain-like protein n=1 Tax=Anaeromyces robustus TaxID=1754192 RepID=A0A1Y1WTR7_9FUNG|nr:L domain-like protein [Anaeromyces robustus]|eukprot:ORX76939.1 L domain-like protein [Anaeromyces robustus]
MELIFSIKFKIFIIVITLIFDKVIADDCVFFEKALDTFSSKYTNYVKDDFTNQNVSNCCDYRQVTCNTIDNEIHITGIDFDDLHIEPINPECITLLSNLKYLTTLKINNSDNFPNDINKLTSLKTLKFNGIGLNDIEFPETISELTNLEVLDLSDNYHIKGKIPQSICNLKNLKTLNLEDCSIEGTIPYCFKDMTKLEELNLKSNEIHGYVPLMPNIKSCNYEWTKVCYLKSTKCKMGTIISYHDCTKEDIESTNRENGNPNPNSNEFDNEIGSSNDNNNEDDDNKTGRVSSPFKYRNKKSFRLGAKLIAMVIIAIILVIVFIVSVIYYCIKDKRLKEHEENKPDNYKIKVNEYTEPDNTMADAPISPTAPTNSFLNYVNNITTANTATTTANVATSPTTYTNYAVPPTALDPNAPPMAYNSYAVPQQPFSPGNVQMNMPQTYQYPVQSNLSPYVNIGDNVSTDNLIPSPSYQNGPYYSNTYYNDSKKY